jgi:DNA polymerase III epsilon subunit-like protein
VSELVQTPVLFLDCQTTGLSASKAEILELGWSLSTSQTIYPRLLKQTDPTTVPKKIWRMTGLDAAQLEAGHEPSEAWSEVLQEAQRAGAVAAVIHYALFEVPFLRKLHAQEQLPWPVICTYKLARRLHPDLPARTIRALSGHFGLDLPETIRTESHVAATRLIWSRFVETLAEREKVSTWEQLQAWLSTPAAKRAAKQPRKYLASRQMRLELPKGPGVYEMFSSSGRLLYVGKATSLRDRVNSYFRQRHTKRARMNELMTQVGDIRVTQTATALEAALLENDRIKDELPPYNAALKTNVGRERPLESLERLLNIQKGELDALELSILNHPPEEMKAVLEDILRSQGVSDFDSLTVADLLRAGKKPLPTPAEEDEVRASVQRKLKRGVRRQHHGAWLRWLTDCTVTWKVDSSQGTWRYLRLNQGQLVESGFIAQSEDVSPRRPRRAFSERALDLKTHDRMRILYTELSILRRKGVPLRIAFSPSRIYSSESPEQGWFNTLLTAAQALPDEEKAESDLPD